MEKGQDRTTHVLREPIPTAAISDDSRNHMRESTGLGENSDSSGFSAWIVSGDRDFSYFPAHLSVTPTDSSGRFGRRKNGTAIAAGMSNRASEEHVKSPYLEERGRSAGGDASRGAT